MIGAVWLAAPFFNMPGTGKYICQNRQCNWTGLNPTKINVEKRDEGVLYLSYLYQCPRCKGTVIYNAFK